MGGEDELSHVGLVNFICTEHECLEYIEMSCTPVLHNCSSAKASMEGAECKDLYASCANSSADCD